MGVLVCAIAGSTLPARAQICGPAIGGGVGCTNALGPAILANGATLPGNIVYLDPAALTINLSGGITIPSVGIGVSLNTGLEGTINVSGGVNNLAAGIGYQLASGLLGTINVSSGAQTLVGGIGVLGQFAGRRNRQHLLGRQYGGRRHRHPGRGRRLGRRERLHWRQHRSGRDRHLAYA